MTDYALKLIMRSEARKRAAEERDIGDDPWSAEEYFKRDSECGNTSGNDFIKGEIQYKGTSTYDND